MDLAHQSESSGSGSDPKLLVQIINLKFRLESSQNFASKRLEIGIVFVTLFQ